MPTHAAGVDGPNEARPESWSIGFNMRADEIQQSELG
jgi:hypothetical protein